MVLTRFMCICRLCDVNKNKPNIYALAIKFNANSSKMKMLSKENYKIMIINAHSRTLIQIAIFSLYLFPFTLFFGVDCPTKSVVDRGIHCGASVVRFVNKKRVHQMGPESGYCEFCGKIDASMGNSISSRNYLSGDQNEDGFSQFHVSLSYNERCCRPAIQYVRRKVCRLPLAPIRSFARHFIVIFHLILLNRIARMEAVSQICDAHLTDGFQLGENFTDHTIFDLIEEVAPTFEETMFFCKWRNDVSFCPFFKPILTEEGMCYTFNALNSEEIYREG